MSNTQKPKFDTTGGFSDLPLSETAKELLKKAVTDTNLIIETALKNKKVQQFVEKEFRADLRNQGNPKSVESE